MSLDHVSVRILPDGEAQPALRRNLTGKILSLELMSLTTGTLNPSTVKRGDLVEVVGEKSLCLGQVSQRDGQHLQISVEHYIDQQELAAIQRHWKESSRF